MSLVVAIVLILANGFFVAVEFALLASLRSRVEEHTSKFRGRLALRSMGRLGIVLAGTQLGVTMASLALGSVAEPAADRFLAGAFDTIGVPEGVAEPVALVLALAIVVFFHLVLGEMVPKSIALARPERTLLGLSLPVGGFLWLFGPVIWVLNRLAAVGSRLLGVEPADELRSTANAAELGLMIEESREEGLIEEEDRELLAVVDAVKRYKAVGCVVETNQGGDMTRSTIHAADPNVHVEKIRAQVSKADRAEPVSMLYPKGWVHHLGSLAKLETQMTTWVPDESKSPDRLDAMVHLVTKLLDPQPVGRATVSSPARAARRQ